jgi:hypothetical protein
MGKGSNTTTTNQTQTYQPNPQAAGYITGALDRANQTAQLPFAIPQAPVAGFSNDQQGAFNAVRNAQGMAQPYINTAANYFSPQGAQAFLNPYASNVMAGLKDVFGQQQSQQTGQLTQAAGGVGADRIAVGQSELAKQQGLAAGQTLSGLYQNAAQQAQSAGYGTAALGSQAQNSALSGAQALLGTGGLQQQLQQAQLNAPYQLEMARAAFPYQQSQIPLRRGWRSSPGAWRHDVRAGHYDSASPKPVQPNSWARYGWRWRGRSIRGVQSDIRHKSVRVVASLWRRQYVFRRCLWRQRQQSFAGIERVRLRCRLCPWRRCRI